MDAQIQLIEWDSWVSDVYQNRQFQSTLVGVDASNITGSAMLQRFTSDNAKNFINYSNADYDAAFEKQSAAPTMTKRPNIIRNVSGFCRKMQPTFIFRTYRSLWH